MTSSLQFLSYDAQYIVFYRQKFGEKAILQQIAPSADKIYQQGFTM